ncbi:MAG: Mrp/NBP35 family ATP-binding protein [Pseudomonadota bacterium]|nr:Mrp/NBP35 family ATP-binding protein [Pseudomonadota bacterium]
MSLTLQDLILKALSAVRLPGTLTGVDVVPRISGLAMREAPEGAHVTFAIEVDPAEGPAFEPLRYSTEKCIRDLPGVATASVVLTAHKQAPPLKAKHREKLSLPNVKRIIAVASGKGGVGKSTTSVNLAVAFMQNGLKAGLLDADIYGPSIPRLLNLSGRPASGEDKKLVPVERYGLRAMSMGFLIPEDSPMIWRGPMVHTAITQLFRDVDWGTLDVLVVDLPPGTGDAQMTMALQVPLSGAIIVSTPQDIALIDARKGLLMFRKMEVPVLGLIENMSYFACPHCGERSHVFGHGGARAEADKLGVPFLGEMPLDIAIRETSDAGEPITIRDKEGVLSLRYRAMAQAVWDGLEAVPA